MKCFKALGRLVFIKLPKLRNVVYKNETQSRSYFSLYVDSVNKLECYNVRWMSLKRYLDYSKVPKINESDIEIQCTRGSGPGGQATNKTNNAVVIKHKPTGIVVKSHATRSMWENKKIAMENLVTKLDNLFNGDDSIEGQTKVYLAKKSADRSRKHKKIAELKAAFKEREGIK